MEAKFTEGDWHIVDAETKTDISVWSSDSDSNCIVSINCGFWDEHFVTELKANAHLIAAAPDMYHEIESDIKKLEAVCQYKKGVELNQLKEIINHKKLITAKARGEHNE